MSKSGETNEGTANIDEFGREKLQRPREKRYTTAKSITPGVKEPIGLGRKFINCRDLRRGGGGGGGGGGVGGVVKKTASSLATIKVILKSKPETTIIGCRKYIRLSAGLTGKIVLLQRVGHTIGNLGNHIPAWFSCISRSRSIFGDARAPSRKKGEKVDALRKNGSRPWSKAAEGKGGVQTSLANGRAKELRATHL